jgi:two-component system, OmpR family, sensor histidine kinase TctE
VLRYLPRADSAGVDLGVTGLEQTVPIKGNRALLEGLLGNLLDNALRYGRATQPHASTVTVSLTQTPETVTLCVFDNGAGLTTDEQQRLMLRGVRGVSADQLGQGAGLGLAIVGKFAALMQAQFSLEASPTGAGLQAKVVFHTGSELAVPAQ